MRVRILGIDPGSYQLGLGCIEKTGNKLVLISAESLHAPKSKPLYERLELIYSKLRERVSSLKPAEIAIEDIFHGQNLRSAFHLGLARGIAIAACFCIRSKIYEYAPTQVKAVVTGYGRSDKSQVKKMTELIMGGPLDLGYDATDALALAICHASQNRRFLESSLRRQSQTRKDLTC